MTDTEYLESRIREQRAELSNLREKESNDKWAAKLHAIYQSLVDKGFTEEQAFTIFLEVFKKARAID